MAVFAKAPVAGDVKTRLVPRLGAEGAARLHAALVRRAVATAARAALGPVQLWCAPDESHPLFTACAGEYGATLHRQRGADLGERMRNAFEEALVGRRALIVVGTDCPALGDKELREARDALRGHDAVIVPAEDGGYVLLGLAKPAQGLFEGIEWGTERVMEQTRRRMAAARLRAVELETLWDVDRPEDYERLRRSGLMEEAAC